jgi:HD superfamily phosphohydrolase
MAISVLQDRKFLVHVSVEVVLLGSMAYFFHHRSKTLEERVKKLEEELITLGDTLQQEILTIKKEMKDDKSNPELQKLYQENSLLRQQLQRQQLSSNQTIQQLQQQYQQLRQMKEQQRAEQDIVENKEQQQRVENKDQRVDRNQHVDYVTDDLIEIFSIPMSTKKTNTTNAVIEVIETDSEEVDLDDELREELQELNQQ